VKNLFFTLSAKLLQYRFLIRASHQRLSDENSIGTILLESRDILSGLHTALRYEEDVLRHQFPQPHGIMNIHRKIFQIPVIDTDDPCAMAAYNATMNTDIPVIYTAVSDPVEAGLANEDGTPVGNITGTSDALAVDAQLKMIREVLPEAKTIGIIYTTSEANSISTIAEYKALAGNYGFEIVDSGVTAMSEVALAAADVASKVDCITNLTDNTVVSALQTVLDEANKAGIPVFGSEVEQVKAGCVASMGLEYIELGKQTGKMAAKVLKGEAKASELNFEVISEPSLYVNFAAAEKIGLELPENYKTDAYQSFDEIVVQ